MSKKPQRESANCTESERGARPPGRIFRPRAIEHYVHRAEEQAIPRLAAPRELAWLWLLVALLTAACLAAGLVLDASTASPAAPLHREVSRAPQ